MNNNITWLSTGLAFAILWASASTATKVALQSAQPMTIAVSRFTLAATIMLIIAHLIRKSPLPTRQQLKQLTVYGTLNIALYLGLYVVAMQHVTAGIGALAVATNPVLISVLSFAVLGTKLTGRLITCMLICTGGVVCAAWPLLHTTMVSASGLFIVFLSMLCYSAGALYFSSRQWHGMELLTINGWQTLIGGLLLFPFAALRYDHAANHYGRNFWLSVVWLAIPVSIAAVQLWMWLLKRNPVKASLWLYLCPLFGFALSAWMLQESITAYTVCGTLLVVAGLAIAQRSRRPSPLIEEEAS